jgi:[ribosomal protein S18]-alanine N-acetyltransferase
MSPRTALRAALVEPMRAQDVPAVAALDASTRLEEAQLRDELARTWSRLWVARDPREGVVAFLLAWHVVDELHVLNICTRADCRRRGFGKAVMATAIAYARQRHVKRMLLEVRRSNEGAIALYRAAGFFATGLRPRYYADDEDAVEMMILFDLETGGIVVSDDEVRF